MIITYANAPLGLTQVLLADDGATQTVQLYGLDLISQDDGSQTRTLLADGLGSTRLEMVNGVVQTTTTYGPYGNLLAQTGSSGTVYGYTGEQEDAATGLVYLRARYYNPNTNQFLTRDPYRGAATMPASQNGYSYVHGNAVNYTDPSGLCIDKWTNEVRMNEYPYGTSGICTNDHWVIEGNKAVQEFYNIMPDISLNGINDIIRYFEVDKHGSASERLEQLLHKTASYKFMGIDPMISIQFGITIPGGEGLCEAFEDKQYYDPITGLSEWIAWDAGANGQMSHFLTAVALSYYDKTTGAWGIDKTRVGVVPEFMSNPSGKTTRSNTDIVLRLIVGHELLGDVGGISANIKQYNAATNYHVNEFIQATAYDVAGDNLQRDMHLENILYSNPTNLKSRPGNSLEDLRLSLKGWRFGHEIKVGLIGSSQNAALWLRSNLTK